MIQLHQLSKIFNQGTADEVVALKPLTLQIEKGSFTIVTGANGSGKSTLLNLIHGRMPPTTGKIMVDDADLTMLTQHARSRWVSMVFQNPAMGTAPDLTVIENFRLASLRTSAKHLSIGNNASFRQLVKDKIAVLGMGLENKTEQAMGSLSGGQRQALTLLMGVMDNTSLLLMDEPTAALDPQSSKAIMELTAAINKEMGITVLLITHNMKDALHYGNRLLHFKEGKLIHDLNADQKRQLTLNQLYEWFDV